MTGTQTTALHEHVVEVDATLSRAAVDYATNHSVRCLKIWSFNVQTLVIVMSYTFKAWLSIMTSPA